MHRPFFHTINRLNTEDSRSLDSLIDRRKAHRHDPIA